MSANRPSFVVLRRGVPVFPDDESAHAAGTGLHESNRQKDALLGSARKTTIGLDNEGSSILEAIKLDAELAAPPAISTLILRVRPDRHWGYGPLPHNLLCGIERVLHKNLVVLWLETRGGDCREYHLVYDAVENSLFMIWTLRHPTRKRWKWRREDELTLPVRSLWESAAFKAEGLPLNVPMNSVTGRREDGVIYFVLGDYCRDRDEDGSHNEREYVIRVDTSGGHLPRVVRWYKP